MPGDRFGVIGIGQPMSACHVGRIACDNIKRSSVKQTFCLFNISCDNIDLILQPTAIACKLLRELLLAVL